MRKSFTQLFGFLLLNVMMLFSFGLYAQEQQSTVELKAPTVDVCYNASNSYTATVSTKDFVAMKSFDLTLSFDKSEFGVTSITPVSAISSGFTYTVDNVAGKINVKWTNATAVTIGDDAFATLFTVVFNVLNFPNNLGDNLFDSPLTWVSPSNFYYGENYTGTYQVSTTAFINGNLNVPVNYSAVAYTVTPATCDGGQATIQITSPVGAGLYYYFNGSTTSSTTPTATAIAPSTNTVRIVDSNGCYSHLFTIPVTAPSPLTFTASTESATCYGGNGEIQFNISGGVGPYTYYIVKDTEWGYFGNTLEQAGKAAAALDVFEYHNFQVLKPAGTYWVNVDGANGCNNLNYGWFGPPIADPQWQQVTIGQPASAVSFTATPTNIQCNGSSTGSIAVSAVSGGTTSPTGSYTASINGVNWFAITTATPTYTFNNLAAGTYTVTVKDYNGCSTASAVTVTQPAAIAFTLTYQDVACGGTVTPTGSITITGVSGGTASYTFAVATSGSAIPSTGWVDAPGTIGSLAAGYYSIWVKDANGCVKAFANQDLSGNVLPIQTPTALAIATSADNAATVEVSCYDGDYTLTVTASGGTAPYSYSYDGGATTTSTSYAMTGLTADTQVTVVVTDASGCTLTKTVTVDVPEELIASIDAGATMSPTCDGGNDGRVRVLVTGGTPAYEYSTDNVKWYTNNVLAVPEGLTTIYVRDARGCTTSTSITITDLVASTLTATVTDINCHGAKTGTISVVNTWQAGRTIQYLVASAQADVYTSGTVFTPASINSVGQTTPTTFVAGTYYLGARDEYGCISNVVMVQIKENVALQMTATVTNATCFGLFDGTLTINTTGGFGQPSYAIVNNAIAIGNLTAANFQPVGTWSATTTIGKQVVQVQRGTYYVVLRDGCVTDNSLYAGPFTVDGYKAITFDGTVAKTNITCHNQNDGTITVPLANVKGGKPEFDGTGNYIFTLIKPVGGTVTNTTGAFTGLAGGTYTVTIKDASNCSSVSTLSNIVITNPAAVVLSATQVKHFTCKDSRDGQISVSATGGIPGYWLAVNAVTPGTPITADNPNWISFGTSTTTTKTYIATEPGVYYLYVKDANGCIGNTVSVTVLEPAVLTPTIGSLTNVACYNGSTGSVQINVTGGWSPTVTQTYEFKVGTTTNTTGLFTGLVAGSYTAYVKVFSGSLTVGGEGDTEYVYPKVACEYSVPFTITQPVPYSYRAVTETVKCKGGADGSLTVTVLGGAAATTTTTGDEYYVQLTTTTNPILGTGSAWKLTSGKVYIFSGLSHGIYSVWIANKNDNTGCIIPAGTETPTADGVWTKSASWEVNEPLTALGASVTWNNNVTCYAGTNGKFTVTATGGVAPYKYAAKISTLPAHILTAPLPGDSEWQDSNVFDHASAATWVIWVMDANGCIVGGEGGGIPVDEWRVQITQPAQVNFASSIEANVTCFGANDGKLKITPSVSAGQPFTIQITGVDYAGNAVNITATSTSTTPIVSNIPANKTLGSTATNTYSVTLTDKNGCSRTLAAPQFVQNTALVVNIVKADGAFLCPGDNNGTIEAIASGGAGSYSYRLWRDGAAYTSWVGIPSFLVEVGHTWAVEVKDANGCLASDSEVINEPVGVTATLSETTCYGDANASVIVGATGEAGRTFSVRYRINTGSYGAWLPLNANNELAISGLLFANVTETENFYYFQVKDDKGCMTGEIKKPFVPTQHPLQVTVEQADLTATVTITGGISPYSYRVGTSTSTVTLPVAGDTFQVVNLAAGQTTITVIDAHGCSVAKSVTVVPLSVVADPASGQDMDSTFDVKLTFNRDVDAASVNSSTISVTGGTGTTTIAGSGKVYTVSLGGADLTTVTLNLSSGIKDLAGNTLSATSFTYTIGDNTAPELTAKSPDQVTIADNHPTFVITFNEDIAVGTGNLKVIKKGGTTPILTIPVTAAMISGKTATVTYVYNATTGGLDKNTEYYVLVDAGAVKDMAGNAFAGVATETTWTFTTGANFATGIDRPVNSSLEFKVYPNPFVESVFVENASELSKIVVTNIAGQVVKEVINPTNTIQLNELRSGVYFMSLYNENTVIKTAKVIKK